MRRCLLSLLALSLLDSCVSAQEKAFEFTITIKGEKNQRQDVPLVVPLSLPAEWATAETATVSYVTKNGLPAQLTAPGIRTETLAPQRKGLVRRDLHLILPILRKDTDFV